MRNWAGILVSLLFIVSCNSDFTYSRYPCYLVIDNSTHMDATLASAMNATAPGVFCVIKSNETAKKFELSTNYGQTSSIRFDQKDDYRTRALGMNNALIVGYGSLTGEFYAFDGECPECYDPDAIPVRSKPLRITNDGNAVCNVCHRKWSMNTGGNYAGTTTETASETGSVKNLTRYHAGTTGPFGVLSVGN